MNICVPITGFDTEEALYNCLEAEKQGADILEFRLDLMNEFILEKLLAAPQLETIVTLRPKDEDKSSKWTGTEEQRYEIFNEATKRNATYIDIEAKHYQPNLFKKRKSKLILSHHDFEKTPEDLESIFQKIAGKKPDIVKIATKANTYDDCRRMLKLIKNAKDIIPIIGICMGEIGVDTRIAGPRCGSYLTFAALEGKKTASGQMSIAELVNRYTLLDFAFK